MRQKLVAGAVSLAATIVVTMLVVAQVHDLWASIDLHLAF